MNEQRTSMRVVARINDIALWWIVFVPLMVLVVFLTYLSLHGETAPTSPEGFQQQIDTLAGAAD